MFTFPKDGRPRSSCRASAITMCSISDYFFEIFQPQSGSRRAVISSLFIVCGMHRQMWRVIYWLCLTSATVQRCIYEATHDQIYPAHQSCTILRGRKNWCRVRVKNDKLKGQLAGHPFYFACTQMTLNSTRSVLNRGNIAFTNSSFSSFDLSHSHWKWP